MKVFALAVMLAITSALARSDDLFDVSLQTPHSIDLSSDYQKVVAEAARHYRGDFPSGQRLTIYQPRDSIAERVADHPFASVSLSPHEI